MRQNADTVLVGRRCVLVPYEAKYVARYHAWMQNEELLRLTASERLTLDEEKSNQQSWRHDEKKLTFIILERAKCFLKRDDRFPASAMAGDVNAFLTVADEPASCEVDVMVAASAMRRRGVGREAVRLFMRYCREALNLMTFVAKISATNQASLKLFEGLAFTKTNYVKAFDEVELRSNAGETIPWTVQRYATAPSDGFEARTFALDDDDQRVNGLVVRFGLKSCFAWVGTANEPPNLAALACAAPRRFAQGEAATNLVDPADIVGPQVASRIAMTTGRVVLCAWSLPGASGAVERCLAARVPPAGCGFCVGLAAAPLCSSAASTAPVSGGGSAKEAEALFDGSSDDDAGVAPPPALPADEPLPDVVTAAVGCARLRAFAPEDPLYVHPALRCVDAPGTGGGRGLAATRDLEAGTLLLMEAPLLSRLEQATITDPAAALEALDVAHLHGATLEEKWQFNAFESGLYRMRSLLNDSVRPSCVALTTPEGVAEVWTQTRVKKGDALTVSYVQPECSVKRRDEYLEVHHGFVSEEPETDEAAETLDAVDDLIEAGDVQAALVLVMGVDAPSRRAAGLAAKAAGRAAQERLVLPRAALGARQTPHGLALFHALRWRDTLAREGLGESPAAAEAAGLAADALDALRAFRGAPDVAAMADRAWGDARAVFQEAQTLRRAAEAGAARFDGRRWVGS